MQQGFDFPKKLGYVIRTRLQKSFMPGIAHTGFSESPNVKGDVEFGDPNAGRLDGQIIFPNSLKMPTAFVEFLRQDHVVMSIVDAKRRDGIAFHTKTCRPQANVRSKKVEVRQSIIESQSRRLPDDQHNFI